MKRHLKPKALAELLNVSERTIRNWQERRIIPFIKIGRVILFDPEKVSVALGQYERKAEC
jgi:excisionase family DNA binding protein